LRWWYVGRSSRVAVALALAITPVALAILIGLLDADVPTMQEVNGPVVLLTESGRQAPGGASLPASTCTELQARSIVAQRLQSAPFPVLIPSERSMTRVADQMECRPGFHDGASPSKSSSIWVSSWRERVGSGAPNGRRPKQQ
jgi:hypothetical protein